MKYVYVGTLRLMCGVKRKVGNKMSTLVKDYEYL